MFVRGIHDRLHDKRLQQIPDRHIWSHILAYEKSQIYNTIQLQICNIHQCDILSCPFHVISKIVTLNLKASKLA